MLLCKSRCNNKLVKQINIKTNFIQLLVKLFYIFSKSTVFATLVTFLMGSARKHIGKDGYHIRKNRKSKKISINEGKSVESLHQFLKSR